MIIIIIILIIITIFIIVIIMTIIVLPGFRAEVEGLRVKGLTFFRA